MRSRIEKPLLVVSDTPTGEIDVTSEDLVVRAVTPGAIPTREVSSHDVTTRKVIEPLGSIPFPVRAPSPLDSGPATHFNVFPISGRSVANDLPLALPKGGWLQRPIVITIAIVAAAIGVVTLWGWWNTPATANTSPGPSTSATSPTPVPSEIPAPRGITTTPLPEEKPRPTEARPPGKIQLAIRVVPKTAALTLDGQAVAGNELRAVVPQDQAIHVVRATAPGFVPYNQIVSFSNDVQLNVELHRSAAPPRGGARSGPPSIVPTARTAPARIEASDEPGMDIRRQAPRRVSRQIDERDPYAP